MNERQSCQWCAPKTGARLRASDDLNPARARGLAAGQAAASEPASERGLNLQTSAQRQAPVWAPPAAPGPSEWPIWRPILFLLFVPGAGQTRPRARPDTPLEWPASSFEAYFASIRCRLCMRARASRDKRIGPPSSGRILDTSARNKRAGTILK